MELAVSPLVEGRGLTMGNSSHVRHLIFQVPGPVDQPHVFSDGFKTKKGRMCKAPHLFAVKVS